MLLARGGGQQVTKFLPASNGQNYYVTANPGKVFLLSSELSEVIGLSDRVLVLNEGRIAATFSRGQISEESILRSAHGLPA